MDSSPQHRLPKHIKNWLKKKASQKPLEGYLNAQEEIDCFQVGSLTLQQNHQEQQLKVRLAEQLGVEPTQLCLGSSPQSLRGLLLQIIAEGKRDNCIGFSPQRPQTQQLLELHQIKQTLLPLYHLAELPIYDIKEHVDFQTKLLVLEHPNAVTGALLQRFDLVDVVTAFESWVLIDESAIGTTPQESVHSIVNTCDNALVLQRTVGGLAVFFAHPEMVEVLERCRPALPLAQLQQATAILALPTNTKEMALVLANLEKERQQLKTALETLPFVQKVYPSSTNTLLIEVTDADAVTNFLRDSERILVYRVPSMEDLQEGIRLTLGTPLDNLRLRKALEQLPEKMNPPRAFWGDVSKGLRKAGAFLGFFKKILGV